MSFPRRHFGMRVIKVTSGGTDVAFATLRFENVTKNLYKEITGTSINSNASYNLGQIGDWDNGDEIKITATKNTETGSKTHIINIAIDHGRHDFEIITISTSGNPYWYYNLLKRRN